MSHTAPVQSGSKQSFMEKNAFVLRRLHSLSGLVPIGVFMCFHLFTNAQMLMGDFQHEVDWIHSQPALVLMEIGLIWLPLAFHAGLGIFYALNGKKYAVARNGGWSHRRYVAQRITGFVALAFILFHVATLRWRLGVWTPFFSYAIDPVDGIIPFAKQSTAIAIQASPWVLVLYILGVFGTVYHFANGLWTAAISWGLTLSVGAQKRFGVFCIGLFAILSAFSVMSFVGSLTYKVTDADKRAFEATKDLYKYGEKLVLEKEDGALFRTSRSVNQTVVETPHFRAEFTPNGQLQTIRLKGHEEPLAVPQQNR